MARAFPPNSAEESSRASQGNMIVDVCNLLAGLQKNQLQLVSQLESLVLAQRQLLLAQKTSEQYTRRCALVINGYDHRGRAG